MWGMTRARGAEALSLGGRKTIYFWCGPCQPSSRFLDELARRVDAIRREKRGGRESLFSQEVPWREERHWTER